MTTSLLGKVFGSIRTPYVAKGSETTSAFIAPGSGREAQMAAFASVSTLFAVVDRLANDTSRVEWHMHRLTGAVKDTCPDCPGSSGVQQAVAHPALTVWNRPNDFFTRQEFVETEQQHIDLTGEGWWVVEKVGSRPVNLWPVRPDRMTPVPSADKFLAGYVYRSPDGEVVPLDLDEVIFIRRPSPLDPYRGLGPVQSLMVDLSSGRAAAEWNARFFINGAEPGGIIQFDKPLSDTDWNKFKERWREQHQGANNAHRVALLSAGTWVDRKYTAKDMEFLGTRNLTRELIREAFGMHGHMLGLTEDVNRANAEAAEATYAKHQTVPRLERFKGALNNDFLKLFGTLGKGYEFVYCNPVPEDQAAENAERESKANAFKTLVEAGAHPEDAAMIVGLPQFRYVGIPTRAVQPADQGGDRVPA